MQLAIWYVLCGIAGAVIAMGAFGVKLDDGADNKLDHIQRACEVR